MKKDSLYKRHIQLVPTYVYTDRLATWCSITRTQNTILLNQIVCYDVDKTINTRTDLPSYIVGVRTDALKCGVIY